MTKATDLNAVRREGKRIRTAHLEVRVSASPLAHPRVGIIVPRLKHSAVERNRLKRRLREIVRLRMLPTVAPADIVIRVRPEAYDATFDELADELTRVGARLGAPPPPLQGG